MSHQCPRPECSRSVADGMYACRGDWYALPERIRKAINHGWYGGAPADYLAAVAEAQAWYAANPPRYATQPGMAQRYQRPRRA